MKTIGLGFGIVGLWVALASGCGGGAGGNGGSGGGQSGAAGTSSQGGASAGTSGGSAGRGGAGGMGGAGAATVTWACHHAASGQCAEYVNVPADRLNEESCALTGGTEVSLCSRTNYLGVCTLPPVSGINIRLVYYPGAAWTTTNAQQDCQLRNGTWSPGTTTAGSAGNTGTTGSAGNTGTTGSAGNTGRGGTTGSAGRGGTTGSAGTGGSGAGCPATITDRQTTCTATGQVCAKSCGVENKGTKDCTCTGGVFVCDSGPSSCPYPAGVDLSCYQLPSPTYDCVAGTMHNAACSDPACLPCSGYLDSTSTLRSGYCVCSASQWKCASTNEWPPQ